MATEETNGETSTEIQSFMMDDQENKTDLMTAPLLAVKNEPISEPNIEFENNLENNLYRFIAIIPR